MSLNNRILPELRRGRLQQLLEGGRKVRLIEAHSGLSGIVGASAKATVGGQSIEFDGIWISSFTSSAARGLPDAELDSVMGRLETVDEVLTATDKPVVVDGDTGGEAVNFEYLCSKLEMMGVSAVVIEDKRIPKRNSLAADARQDLEDPRVFGLKIARGRAALKSRDFMIFARIESFISGAGVEDALGRARTYLRAGADGIVVHSKNKGPEEIYAFLQGYEVICKELAFRRPVVCIPSAFHSITCEELFSRGIQLVIHANHLLRASHKAMDAVCKLILLSSRTLEADEICTPMRSIFDQVGFTDILRREQ